MNIPLVIESKAFVENLKISCMLFDENKYLYKQRVNYSYRFSSEFIDEQLKLFQMDPSKYLSVYGLQKTDKFLNVYEKKLTRAETFRILVKVLAHRLFRFIGSFQCWFGSIGSFSIYRKAYVDDIDLVYDRGDSEVLMAIYPFPIKLSRQLKFISNLIKDKQAFRLDGYRYRLKFVLNLLYYRDVRSYEMLEKSAAYLKSLELADMCFQKIELSDEFDINCLPFTRFCRRAGLFVINKTHGIGKYFPMQCFDEFYVLDNKMTEYYELEKYSNFYKFDLITDQQFPEVAEIKKVVILFLSQKFDDSVTIIGQAEDKILSILTELNKSDGLKIYYKPHPNHLSSMKFENQRIHVISSINDLNINEDFPILISLFSSTHIDPNFYGAKLLVETEMIKPNISFSNGQIVSLNDLSTSIKNLNNKLCMSSGPYEFSNHGDLIRW